MKIEYNNNLSIPIENIKAGECFLFKDKLNMKIDINGYISVDAAYCEAKRPDLRSKTVAFRF